MFTLKSTFFRDLKIVLVEDEQQSALAMSASIKDDGGTVVGIAPTIARAAEIARSAVVDMVLLHVRYIDQTPGDLTCIFEPFGAAVEFFNGFDDWYDPE